MTFVFELGPNFQKQLVFSTGYVFKDTPVKTFHFTVFLIK